MQYSYKLHFSAFERKNISEFAVLNVFFFLYVLVHIGFINNYDAVRWGSSYINISFSSFSCFVISAKKIKGKCQIWKILLQLQWKYNQAYHL